MEKREQYPNTTPPLFLGGLFFSVTLGVIRVCTYERWIIMSRLVARVGGIDISFVVLRHGADDLPLGVDGTDTS